MGKNRVRNKGVLLTIVYLYLALPMVIFLLGWCRWYIGVPIAILVIVALALAVKEHISDGYMIVKSTPSEVKENDTSFVIPELSTNDIYKLLVVIVIILIWTGLAGIGGLMWQNGDHAWRNTIFDMMVNYEWPVMGDALTWEFITENRGLVYYTGFWLPAALVGKSVGLEAGYMAQYVWAVVGIVLFYCLVCTWRKKVEIWPLITFILFSGLDSLGVIFTQAGILDLFGMEHLEAWSVSFQYSSNTTLLFWVFNQAIPVWIAAMLIFIGEKPRNIIFVLACTLLTSTFPFVGLIPFVIYFMIKRGNWNLEKCSFTALVKQEVSNWLTVQNIAGFAMIAVGGIYLIGTRALGGYTENMPDKKILLVVLLVLAVVGVAAINAIVSRGNKVIKTMGKIISGIVITIFVVSMIEKHAGEWQQTELYYWINLTIFYFLEIGVYLVILKDKVKDKGLLKLTAVWMYIIPLIVVGVSCDFCMRASIPGLLIVWMWCVQALSEGKKEAVTYLIIGTLVLGAITPIHEIKRTYVYTRNGYEMQRVPENDVLNADNFSGNPELFFWRFIAK